MKVFIALLLGILLGLCGYYLYQRWQASVEAETVLALPQRDADQESDWGPTPEEPAGDAPAPAPIPRQDPLPMSGVSTPPSGAALLVPVQGVRPDELENTFTDARSEGRSHDAIDIMAPAGTPVLAVADGTVAKLFNSERGGLTIYQFEPDGRLAYYYAHLRSYAEGLEEGQAISRGQVIGFVGSTGNADPEGPHLHFAVFVLGPERNWWQGEAINPYPLLTGDASRLSYQR
jgi:murein DD-endopeptidase MepM/ murein hydrolase activator NlpD